MPSLGEFGSFGMGLACMASTLDKILLMFSGRVTIFSDSGGDGGGSGDEQFNFSC